MSDNPFAPPGGSMDSGYRPTAPGYGSPTGYGPPPGYGAPTGYGPPQPYPPGSYPPPTSVPPPGYPPGVGRRRRRGWVVAAVLAGGALVAGGVLAVQWSRVLPLADTDVTRTAWPGALGPGHCIEALPDDGAVTSVRVVPCDTPHQGEVLGRRHVSGDEFPGADQLTDTAVASCEMDRSQLELGFEPVVWTPSEGAWGLDRRDALCLAALPNGTAIGSFTAGDQVSLD